MRHISLSCLLDMYMHILKSVVILGSGMLKEVEIFPSEVQSDAFVRFVMWCGEWNSNPYMRLPFHNPAIDIHFLYVSLTSNIKKVSLIQLWKPDVIKLFCGSQKEAEQ